MHVAEERLQRLLDGELPPAEEKAVRDHLSGCAECRGALIEAEHEERQAQVLMRALDQPAPDLDLEAIVARGREPEEATAPPSAPTSARPTSRRRMMGRRVAALAFALLVAGAAYGIPGSPLQRWVRSVVERMRSSRASVEPAPAPADRAGIAVTPGADLVIEFSARQSEGRAHVTLTDGAELVIRAPSGAATFTSDVDRLVVDNRGGAANFEIEVPREAPRVEIRLAGATVFLKVGARVTHATPAGEAAYQVPLGP